jgi:hypothetical protein
MAVVQWLLLEVLEVQEDDEVDDPPPRTRRVF